MIEKMEISLFVDNGGFFGGSELTAEEAAYIADRDERLHNAIAHFESEAPEDADAFMGIAATLGDKRDAVMELLGAEGFAEFILAAYKRECEARAAGWKSAIMSAQMAAKLGSGRMSEYTVEEFCRIFSPQIVGEKIKIEADNLHNMMPQVVGGYISRHRAEIIKHLEG